MRQFLAIRQEIDSDMMRLFSARDTAAFIIGSFHIDGLCIDWAEDYGADATRLHNIMHEPAPD